MKKLIYLILAFIGLFLFVCSCAPVNPQGEDGTLVYSDSNFTVIRFIDTEKDAVCWLMDGFESGGISCIPNGQLK